MAQRTKSVTTSRRKAPATAARTRRSAPAAKPDTSTDVRPDQSFPIVGIGCSAGGLEALEKFFTHVVTPGGMAYVVVQHLDPNHASTLPDLIRRITPMPVKEARNRMKVQPDNIYVIPPNKELMLKHDTLHLLDPVSPRGLRLPVDFFLRSLAGDRNEHAIGVILSGMGSDGMLGLRAIKENSGLTLAQEPADAKASGMPKSVIDAGLADIIAPAAELPARIASFVNLPAYAIAGETPETDSRSGLEKIIALLRDRCGSDFSGYKTSTMYRRIERRTALHQLSGIAAYVQFLRDNPQELDLLFKELMIGVTNFFRDPAMWDALRDKAIPALLEKDPAGGTLRAWVPACSSGEEAYSLAIVFREALERIKPVAHFALQIYATDLDADAIDKARRGAYPSNIAADVSPERLSRFFVPEDGGYRVGKVIRDMVVFAPQNVISDPPFTKLDILSCRNLLIYLSPPLQKKLLPLFHYALNREGILVLGSAETVGNFTDLFAPLDNKARIFRRIELPAARTRLELPARQLALPPPAGMPAPVEARDSLEYLTDQMIQQNYAPAAVLVTGEGDIVYFSGRTGKYLEPAAGKVNINIHAMARLGLREALTGVIRNALRDPQPIKLRNLPVATEGGPQIVDVTVQRIDEPEIMSGKVLIVFQDLPSPAQRRRGRKSPSPTVEALETELQQTREALRVAHEEMQTSIEEYKSSNEELQSTNEELQSTNEELTTSKEELQSLNEELQTVNAELESKVEELTAVRNDMTNLLNSTEIATIFLDDKMKLRRFTSHATQLFKLIPGDIGRPLSDIVSVLDYSQLQRDAREVLSTLVFREKEISSHDGRWYRLRIMPYRTIDNVIDGVVITFIDITEIKHLELRLKETCGDQDKPDRQS